MSAIAGHRGFTPKTPIIGDVKTMTCAYKEVGNAGYADISIHTLVADQDKASAGIAHLAQVKTPVD